MRLTILVLVVFVSTCIASPRFMRREGTTGRPETPKDGGSEPNDEELKKQLEACREFLKAAPECSQNLVDRVLTRMEREEQKKECGKLLALMGNDLNRPGDEKTDKSAEEESTEEGSEVEKPEEETQEPSQKTEETVRMLLEVLSYYDRK